MSVKSCFIKMTTISKYISIANQMRVAIFGYRELISRYREIKHISRYRKIIDYWLFLDIGNWFPDIGNSNSRYREIIPDIGKCWIKTQMAFHRYTHKQRIHLDNCVGKITTCIVCRTKLINSAPFWRLFGKKLGHGWVIATYGVVWMILLYMP